MRTRHKKKAKLAILERIFASEIGGYPLQNFRPNDLYAELVKEEMIEQVRYEVKQVVCRGWVLTPRGHITYCESCG